MQRLPACLHADLRDISERVEVPRTVPGLVSRRLLVRGSCCIGPHCIRMILHQHGTASALTASARTWCATALCLLTCSCLLVQRT